METRDMTDVAAQRRGCSTILAVHGIWGSGEAEYRARSLCPMNPEVPASHAQLLAQGSPQARLDIRLEAGHRIPTQNTAQVAQHLQAFLSQALKEIHENQ